MAIHADKMYTCVGTQDYAHTYDTCGIPPPPSFKIVLLHQKPPPLWVHHSTPPVPGMPEEILAYIYLRKLCIAFFNADFTC